MAKLMCKCAICGVEFDRNLIQAVKHGARRYSHATCEPDNYDYVPLGPEADPDRQKILEYVAKLFKEPNYAMINKQLKKFTEENGYSYSGILKSLVYFFEIKGNSPDKANNAIGIVPFVYTDAYNYYYALFLAQHANEDRTLVTTVREFTIKPPHQRGQKKKLLEWEIDDEE